jgi:hypothetical protein
VAIKGNNKNKTKPNKINKRQKRKKETEPVTYAKLLLPLTSHVNLILIHRPGMILAATWQ